MSNAEVLNCNISTVSLWCKLGLSLICIENLFALDVANIVIDTLKEKKKVFDFWVHYVSYIWSSSFDMENGLFWFV